MRAAVLTEAGPTVEMMDVDVEDPRHGEVLVRVHSCGICHSDLSFCDLGGGGQAPVILGHEAAGVVEGVGAGVTSVAPGDSVLLTPLAPCGRCYYCVRGQPTLCADAQAFTTGRRPDGTTPFSIAGEPVQRGLGVAGWGELTVVSETGVAKLDPDTPLDVACLIGCALQTGVGAVLNTATVEAGATVLVTGLGGIGISIVQGARLAGASRIIASDPVASRRDAALHFGATDVIDPTADDVIERVMAETGGIGVDYAFEGAGVAALVETCVGASRIGGTTVVVGVDVTLASASILPVMIASHGKRIVGSLLGDCHPQRDIPRLVGFWRSGRLDLESMISHRLDLADVNEGLDRLRAADGIRTVLQVAG